MLPGPGPCRRCPAQSPPGPGPTPPSAAPRNPAELTKLVETIVAALGDNGSEPARKTLEQILAGTLATDDDKAAVEAALKALVAHPSAANDALLFRVLTAPEALRPADRQGPWPAKDLQAKAFEIDQDVCLRRAAHQAGRGAARSLAAGHRDQSGSRSSLGDRSLELRRSEGALREGIGEQGGQERTQEQAGTAANGLQRSRAGPALEGSRRRSERRRAT